jgi:hypothetical protein
LKSNGIVTIDFGIDMLFSEGMKDEINGKGRKLADRLLEVKVIPGWSPDEEGYDKVLDFTWQLVEA